MTKKTWFFFFPHQCVCESLRAVRTKSITRKPFRSLAIRSIHVELEHGHSVSWTIETMFSHRGSSFCMGISGFCYTHHVGIPMGIAWDDTICFASRQGFMTSLQAGTGAEMIGLTWDWQSCRVPLLSEISATSSRRT